MAFSFLKLPVELQVEVINEISLYSDLKALCLVSKAFSSIATPQIYYRVDLETGCMSGKYQDLDEEKQDRSLMLRICSLLVQPANLCFVKVLWTGCFGLKSTILMNAVLPLLRNDSLIEFRYSTHSENCFPTPLQFEFLWGRQKRLQNLELYSHMVPWLEEFLLRQKPSENTLLKSFTKLSIGDSIEISSITPNILCWPLKNLNLRLLQRLSINGKCFGFEKEYLTFWDLLASQSFANLAELSLQQISFEKTVRLTNVPKLKSLVVKYCVTVCDFIHDYELDLPFEFPDNFQLQSLEFWSWQAEPLPLLLTQVRGLKKLVIGIYAQFIPDEQVVTDIISAVMLHKDTLRLFEITGRFQGYTVLSQIFPGLRLENLPNFYCGSWSGWPQLYTVFRLSADDENDVSTATHGDDDVMIRM